LGFYGCLFLDTYYRIQRMNIALRNFLPAEKINIAASTWYELGRMYGEKTSTLVKQKLALSRETLIKEQHDVTARIASYYSEFEHLTASQVFTIRSVNWLACYRDFLLGFAKGCKLSLEDCILLQMLDTVGCQTMVVKQKNSEKTALFHLEENFDDKGKSYDYRMVTARIGELEYSFFCYPGVCFGGSTMGVNFSTRTFIAVDSLYTRSSHQAYHRLWSNALAAVIFMIGDIADITILMHRLKKYGIASSTGLATHFVQRLSDNSVKLYSIEYCDGAFAFVSPRMLGDREYIAQANYSLSRNCQLFDTLRQPVSGMDDRVKMDAYEMKRRTKRLRQWAGTIPLTLSSIEDCEQYFAALCKYSPPDYFSVSGVSTISGMMNKYQVAYSFGFIDEHAETVVFGKSHPYFLDTSKWNEKAKIHSEKILRSGIFNSSKNHISI
jgi:hypothetical protein